MDEMPVDPHADLALVAEGAEHEIRPSRTRGLQHIDRADWYRAKLWRSGDVAVGGFAALRLVARGLRAPGQRVP